jgi:uncharacterized membrane protein
MRKALENLKVTWKLFLVGVAIVVCALSAAWAMVAASGWRLLGFGLVMAIVVMTLLRVVAMMLGRFRVDERTIAEAVEAEARSLAAAKDEAARHEADDQERQRRVGGGRMPSLPPAPAMARYARRVSSRSLRPEPLRGRGALRGKNDSMAPPSGGHVN